jgi:hypothetical protein
MIMQPQHSPDAPPAQVSLINLGTRVTRDPEEHIALAKRAYVQGRIEIEELERRVGLALEGLAVRDQDVPLFDRPDVWMTDGSGHRHRVG